MMELAQRIDLAIFASTTWPIAILFSAVAMEVTKDCVIATHNPMHDIVDDSDEDDDEHWNKTLAEYKIIPDVISQGVPYNLKVLFEDEHLDYGNILVPFRVKQEPIFVGWPSEFHNYYTILMTDPDNPSPDDPVHREWLHWMVVNVQDKVGEKFADRVVKYQIPQQNKIRKLKGMHRYVIAVYEQPWGKIKVEEVYKDEPNGADRAHFSSKQFIKKYNLSHACGCNFFRINWM